VHRRISLTDIAIKTLLVTRAYVMTAGELVAQKRE
jgi:hypothetical protein